MIRRSPVENSVAKAARMLSSGFSEVRSCLRRDVHRHSVHRDHPALAGAAHGDRLHADRLQHLRFEVGRQRRSAAGALAAIATSAAVSSFSCSQTLRKLAIEGM